MCKTVLGILSISALLASGAKAAALQGISVRTCTNSSNSAVATISFDILGTFDLQLIAANDELDAVCEPKLHFSPSEIDEIDCQGTLNKAGTAITARLVGGDGVLNMLMISPAVGGISTLFCQPSTVN